MRFFYLITIVLLITFPSISFAGSNEYTGIWEFTIDKSLNGQLNPENSYLIKFNSHSEQMMGTYLNIDNDSNWEIQFYSARGRKVITGIQRDNTYYRVLNGELYKGTIIGTWYDVGGASGDFKMTKK